MTYIIDFINAALWFLSELFAAPRRSTPNFRPSLKCETLLDMGAIQ